MTKLTSIKNIKQIVCGYHHTLIVTVEGHVYGWGKNTEKQILPSDRDSIAIPTNL
jgi:alpha-tubulin suppressor-like RCC1 family protein